MAAIPMQVEIGTTYMLTEVQRVAEPNGAGVARYLLDNPRTLVYYAGPVQHDGTGRGDAALVIPGAVLMVRALHAASIFGLSLVPSEVAGTIFIKSFTTVKNMLTSKVSDHQGKRREKSKRLFFLQVERDALGPLSPAAIAADLAVEVTIGGFVARGGSSIDPLARSELRAQGRVPDSAKIVTLVSDESKEPREFAVLAESKRNSPFFRVDHEVNTRLVVELFGTDEELAACSGVKPEAGCKPEAGDQPPAKRARRIVKAEPID